MKSKYSDPHYSRVFTTALFFYKRPTLVYVFDNQKKSEENFRFYEKR